MDVDLVSVEPIFLQQPSQHSSPQSLGEFLPEESIRAGAPLTDASFLDVHKAELRDTERVITKANTNGWSRQIDMNEQEVLYARFYANRIWGAVSAYFKTGQTGSL